MALVDRLLGTEEPKIPVHSFMAAVSEITRGVATVAQVAAMIGLDAAEETQLTNYMNVVATKGNLTNRLLFIHETEQVLIIGETGWAYTTPAAISTRLGL